jgi:hypothetical protein
MVILVADHPVIVAAELKISLPKTVAMFSLETPSSPGFSWLIYWMVQASFAYDPVGLVVVDGEAFVVRCPAILLGPQSYLCRSLMTFCFRESSMLEVLGCPFGFSLRPFFPSVW